MDDRTQELLVERHGAVLEITLNRPKVNAIDFDLSRRINEAVVMLRDDPELRVGLVTATGEKMFSAGWDLKALDAGEAEIIVEARSSGVGIDKSDTMLGIPAIPIPVPGVGTFSTPELPVFKRALQHGRAGISLTGFERATGKHVFSIGPVYGNAIRDNIFILGLPLYRGRINLPK